MTQIPTNPLPLLIFLPSTPWVTKVSGLVTTIRAASQKQNGQDLGSYKAHLSNLLGLLKDLTVGEIRSNIVVVADIGDSE